MNRTYSPRPKHSGTWTDEPAAEAVARTALGQRFFGLVFAESPELAGITAFLRYSEQPQDVWAMFDWPGGGAGAQISNSGELICVWGADGQAEYGDWLDDPVPPALDHLRRLLADRP